MDLKRLADRPWSAFAVYMAVTAGLYSLAVRVPWRSPLVIGPSPLDLLVPLVPAAAWIYATYLLLLPILMLLASGKPGFKAVFATAMGCGIANAVVYNLLPSRILERTPAPGGSLLALIQWADTTLGAIPSGHVALPASIAIASWLASRATSDRAFWRRLTALFSLWTLFLAVSTLLTKQHYFPDAIAGLGFGLMMGAGGMGAMRVLRNAHGPSVIAYLRDWAVIVAALAAALACWSVPFWSLPVSILAALVIASRQHAILVLYHDGVHGLVARGNRANDFIVNSFAGVPLMLPIHMYRVLHQSHHRRLGEKDDPERVLLYRGQPWNYRPLASGPLAVQLIGDLFAWNGVIMMFRYFLELRPGGALKLPQTRWYPELSAQFLLLFAAIAVAFHLWPAVTVHALLLWYLPYFTLTQLLQKVRSFAEHASSESDASLSCSWSPGTLGRLTIWPYNINYHREHHSRADVPWDLLPDAFPSAVQRPGRDLIGHLWKRGPA